MKWRIYRLPGSREWWLIDFGPGTAIFQVKKWSTQIGTWSVADSSAQPRAWIAAEGNLFMLGNEAIFYAPGFRFEGKPCELKA